MRLIIVDFGNEFVESENLDVNIKFMKECMDKGDAFLLDSYLPKEETERLIRENGVPYSLLSLYGGAIVYDDKGKINSYSELHDSYRIYTLARNTHNSSVEFIKADMEDRSKELKNIQKDVDEHDCSICAVILSFGNGLTKKVRIRLNKLEETLNSTLEFTRLTTHIGQSGSGRILVTNHNDLSSIVSEMPTREYSKAKIIDTRRWPDKGLLAKKVNLSKLDTEE